MKIKRKAQWLPLSPYPGGVLLVNSRKEFYRQYKKYTKKEWPHGDAAGTTVQLTSRDDDAFWLVHAENVPDLSHELGHVLFLLFQRIGSDPTCGNQEPFCYMMSHLMKEALKP